MRRLHRQIASVLLAIILVVGFAPTTVWAIEDAGEGTAVSSSSSSENADAAETPSSSSSASGSESSSSSSSASGSSSASSSSSSSGSAPDPQPDVFYVDKLLLQWDEPDEHDVKHFVGEDDLVEEDYRQIKVNDFGKTVQLNGWYLSTDGTGEAYQTADSSTRIGSFDLEWKSSDEEIATVSPKGLVTPNGKNGSVVITATVADENVYDGEAPSAEVEIAFEGQEGRYVTKVEILDEHGNNIGEDWGEVTVYGGKNEFHQLQARVTWCDAVTKAETVEVTGRGDDYDASKVGTTIEWSVSSSTAFSINADTGRLRTGGYSGVAYVTCKAVGGLGGKAVVDTANVQLDTGVYEYNPANSITLKVVWEERPDEVVKEATYSYDELKRKLRSIHVNATVANNSRYGVVSADGWLFKDVVDLVSIADTDVLQFCFSTADGYDNPVSYDYLFNSGNRYYFPNYDIGSRSEGQVVAPVLAYRSAFEWNRSEANPDATLDEGNRFRLVFGCLASGDANTSFQIYYIHGITVVLKGGPSAGGAGGDDDAGKKEDGEDASEDPAEQEVPEVLPEPGGASGGGKGTSDGAGNGGGNAPTVGELGDGGGDPNGYEDLIGEGDASVEGAGSGAHEGDAVGADIDSAKRWRVYQMMNKNDSDVPDWDDENPLSPFAIPMTAGTLAASVGATGFSFWRRLR